MQRIVTDAATTGPAEKTGRDRRGTSSEHP
jgi:hypothetical protein